VGDICRQIKNPTRNGGPHCCEHIAKDDLVAWAWRPGVGDAGTRNKEQLGTLFQDWIETGAECP
jgi:hypothetical protein